MIARGRCIDTAKFDIEITRYVAAWSKAYDEPPDGGELAVILGITARAACNRMAHAARRGWLAKDPYGGHRCYTPNYARLGDRRLATPRPDIERLAA